MTSTVIGLNEIIAIFANIFEAVGNVPLFLSIYKGNSNDNFSISFCTFRLVSSVLWIIYGIKTELFLATFSSYFSMLSSLILILCKIKDNNKQKYKYEALNGLLDSRNNSFDSLDDKYNI